MPTVAEPLLVELRGLLERHARPDMATAVEGVRICRIEPDSQPEPSMSGTVLAVVAAGGKRLALGDHVYEYGPGQYLVTSADLPVTGTVVPGRPALGFGMSLKPAVIAELLVRAQPGDLPVSTDAARPGIAVSAAPPDLLDAVVRLLRLLDRPGDRRVLAAPGAALEVVRAQAVFEFAVVVLSAPLVKHPKTVRTWRSWR